MPEPTDPTRGADQVEQTGGRGRLWDAVRRPTSRGQLVAAVLLAGLGFAAVAQVQSNDQDDKYIGTRQADLIQLINQLTLASQRADNEIAQLQQTRDSLRSNTDSRRTAIRRAREQADTLGILAGTLPVEGSGIRVTVKDRAGGVGTDQILNGIEELRDAGAEAIEINNTIRVVARTSIQDATDGGVVIDGQQLKAPYVIEAIGDPATLSTALDLFGGFVFGVEQIGGAVSVDKLDTVEITTVVPTDPPGYAQPSPTQ